MLFFIFSLSIGCIFISPLRPICAVTSLIQDCVLCTPSCHFTLILKFKLLLSGACKDPPLFSPLRRDHELFSVEETRLPSQTCCMYSAYSDACLSELLHGLCTLLARHIKAKLLKPFCQQLFIDLKKCSPANGYCLDFILPLKTRH